MTEIEEKIKKILDENVFTQYDLDDVMDFEEAAREIAKLVTDIQAATWSAARETYTVSGDVKNISRIQTKYPFLTDYNNRSEPLNEKK